VAKILHPAVWGGPLSVPRTRKLLHAGGLPKDKQAIELLQGELFRIGETYKAWATAAQQFPNQVMAERFEQIARLSKELELSLTDNPQRQLESVLGSRWPRHELVDLKIMRAGLHAMAEIAAFHAPVYRAEWQPPSWPSPPPPVTKNEPQNWLLAQIDGLATQIRGKPSGLGGPLYRFVVGCLDALEIGLDRRKKSPPSKRVRALGQLLF
jgi:hypothetical protein